MRDAQQDDQSHCDGPATRGVGEHRCPHHVTDPGGDEASGEPAEPGQGAPVGDQGHDRAQGAAQKGDGFELKVES